MWLAAAVHLSSGDLLLEHIRKVALALDREDQCKGGRYLQRQLYYGGTAMVRLEAEVKTRDATNISNYVSGDSDKMFPLKKNIPLVSDGIKIVLIPT